MTLASLLASAAGHKAAHPTARSAESPTTSPDADCRRTNLTSQGERCTYIPNNSSNEIVADEPDPAAANALQEGLGGQFGEMRTMMQYLFQSFNFRGATAKPFRDLLY